VDETSSELMVGWQAGDERAAETLFRRYFARLHGLIRANLTKEMASRFDAEDVAQSAFRSFFSGARDGKYLLQYAGDLWRLLAAIAMHKIRHEQKRHTAAKRDCFREQLPAIIRAALDEDDAWLAHDPTPEEAAVLADEVQWLLRPLDGVQRQMVELRLQGFSLEEIAAQVHRSQRTVRRVMEQVKERLTQRTAGQLP
jgi:RNA polymerase sigma factor (sigma-70 family)